MNFKNIKSRRLFLDVPDEIRADWLSLSWQAQGLYWLIVSKATYDGYLFLGALGERGLAPLLGYPAKEYETMKPHTALLFELGFIALEQDPLRITIRWFKELEEVAAP